MPEIVPTPGGPSYPVDGINFRSRRTGTPQRIQPPPTPPDRVIQKIWGHHLDEEAMPSFDNTTTLPLETIKPPRCAMCRTQMELLGRETLASGAETHAFRCPACEFTKTKIVGSPANTGRHRAPRKR
jgi:hypothetical protein